MSTTSPSFSPRTIALGSWVRIGLIATVTAIVAVLAAQLLATRLWPEIVLFKPLDSYARSALFVIVPGIGATGLFAWLAQRSRQADTQFLRIAVVVLLVSIVPDYLLPVEHKTILASTVAAFLHVVAGIVIIAALTNGYRRMTGSGNR
ncbi:MAG: hypothetical protein KJZ86_20160 [Caldilineaceae bacterium]|nr:hypothetical protein [Caldilineaceae bacterium]HRJ43844.1 DUF6069 family protein [Caldilineaceae bacterium]